MKMVSKKNIRVGASIYKANKEVDVKKEDVPTFQKLGFTKFRSKPAPQPLQEEPAEQVEEEEADNGEIG